MRSFLTWIEFPQAHPLSQWWCSTRIVQHASSQQHKVYGEMQDAGAPLPGAAPAPISISIVLIVAATSATITIG